MRDTRPLAAALATRTIMTKYYVLTGWTHQMLRTLIEGAETKGDMTLGVPLWDDERACFIQVMREAS
jgi:hypothetical protein